MPIFYPGGRGPSGRGGGGRTTFNAGTFADLAALNTWGAANLNSLFNNNDQDTTNNAANVTVATIGTMAFEWTGDNKPTSYPSGGSWTVRAGEGTNLDPNIPDNTILLKTGGSNAAFASSALTQQNQEVESSMPIASPSAGAYRLGNLDIFNDGIGISVQDLAANLDYIPVAYQRSNTGSERPTREIYSGQATTPPAAGSVETFEGAQLQFAVRNVGRGTAQSYTLVVPSDAIAVTDCNITIRYNSHGDANPVFDYKESTGGTGFDLVAGDGSNDTDSLITLPRAAFFPDGVDIYVTLSAGANQTLRLRGETLDLTSIGLGMQDVPRITVMGQATVQKELADLDDTEHPVTLRRDMPSLEDSLALVNASLNQNSALWMVANNQITNSNRGDALMRAQIEGLLDVNGDEIPTTPVTASTLQLRAGSIVRIFAQNDFRVVSAPVVESDISNGGIPTTPQPSFTRFAFDSQPTSVTAGTTISGTKTFLFRFDRVDLLTGNITIRQGNTVISSGTIPVTSTSADVAITSATLNANDEVVFTAEATKTSGGVIRAHITVRAAAPHEFAYWGIRQNNDFSAVDISNLNSVDVTTNSSFDVTGSFNANHYIGILVPVTHDAREITTFNLPAKSSFTRTANARTINSVSYILYTLQNGGGINGEAAYTVEV